MSDTIRKHVKTVENLVADIVKEYFIPEGVNYLFMDWSQTNVELDRLQGPTIAYILPASGTVTLNPMRQRIYDAPRAQIAFMTPTEFDFKSQRNDNRIEQMKRLMIAFVNAVNESGKFEPIEGELEYQVIYDYLDENVTGIIITPELKELEGIALCAESIEKPSDLFKKLFGHEIIGSSR